MKDSVLQEARKQVRRMVKASGTSFAEGMRVLPKERREAMYALYAFCREVDDIADDSPTIEARERGLALWHHRIRLLFQEGKAEGPICVALLPAIKAYGLVEEDFQAIIEGMDMDAREVIFAPSMVKLDAYCDHVASAVGRASVRIFGESSDAALRVAHHLGRALQLTNILRDLAEDAIRGRLYLPRELLSKHGLGVVHDAFAVLDHSKLPVICRDMAIEAQAHFDGAEAAMRLCDPRVMRPARAMRDYYHAILRRLLKEDWRHPRRRISLSPTQKIALIGRGLWGGLLSSLSKRRRRL